MNVQYTQRLALLLSLLTFTLIEPVMAQATGGPSGSELTRPGATIAATQAEIQACQDKAPGDPVRFVDAKGKKRHWACAEVDGVLAARSGVGTAALVVGKK